jgi:O-succinylbenzoic acid--CoA ligase
MNHLPPTTDWLRARAEASPQATALVIGGRSWRFAELDALASRLCGHLRADGLDAGDHVGVLMPNSLATVIHVFALAQLGAVLVPLNTRLTAAELAWQIERADCARLVCTPSLEARGRDAAGAALLCVAPEEPATFEQWLDGWPTLPPGRDAGWSPDALQAVVFTSGTTGYAKGATITFANHFWSAIGSAFRLGVSPDDRWLTCLPLYHVGGLAILFRSCLYGTAVVLHNGFDAGAVRHSLAMEEITLVSLVPTMLQRLLHEELTGADAPRLRLALLGGAALPPDLAEAARRAGIPVAATYGLTEAASQVATRLPTEERAKPGSVGRPLLFTRVAVVAGDGRELPPGEVGEIVVAGPTVMAGYYRDPAATAAALRGGRLHTGDLGYLDDEGDLWVLDRRGDLIVSGGENVYPAEVERVLREHPAVALACVVGLPDSEWGQRVAAAVTLRRPGQATEEELLAFTRERLAGYKQPRLLALADELPQTSSGKIQRRAVVEWLMAGRPAARPERA